MLSKTISGASRADRRSRLFAALLLLLMFLAGLSVSTDYSMSWDEPHEIRIFQKNIRAYADLFLGEDSQVVYAYESMGLNSIRSDVERDHGQGAYYPFALYMLQPRFLSGDYSYTSVAVPYHYYTFALCFTAIIAFYLLVTELFGDRRLALLCATLIGIIRMSTMGIPPLALTGAVFGAFLSGVLYRASKGRLICAVIGEVVGTGIIGAIVSYPVMTFLVHKEGLTWLFYVPSFLCGTLIGGSVAFVFLRQLARAGVLPRFQRMLSDQSFEEGSSPVSNAAAIAALGVIGYLIIKILTSMVLHTTDPLWNWVAWGAVLLAVVIALAYYLLHPQRKQMNVHE